MKLVFHLSVRKIDLSVHFIRAKYKCVEGVPSSLRNTNCSRLWKGLSIVWNDVRTNPIWTIGSGKDVDFWYDSWINDIGLLIDYVDPILASTIG
ncbi:hypothetical protein V6N13_076597 [Hibiscus sabdariffa]